MNPPGALRLIPGLKFTPHVQGNNRWYAVEDPRSGRFLKLGFTEYLIVSCLQNGLMPPEICKSLEHHDLAADQAQEHVAMTISWLAKNGLLLTDTAGASNPGPSANSQGNAGKTEPSAGPPLTGIFAFDPFFVRMPLLSGAITEAIARPMCALLTPWAAAGLVVAVVVAVFCLLSGADRFLYLEQKLFVEDGRLWWIVAWLMLKAVHELGHAVAAICVGSRIRSAGLHLIYMGPVPYIDVTDMWTISTRRHRILVSACGMLFEGAVAAVAVIVATFSTNPQVQYFCAALATLGTVTTIAFNANPLMRFDGYYMMSDWLSHPNLWTEAQTAVNDCITRILNPFAKREGRIKWGLVVYGLSCTISRILVMVTLAWWLLTVWDGIGVLVAIWGSYCWFFRPWYLKRVRAAKGPAAATAGAVPPTPQPSSSSSLNDGMLQALMAKAKQSGDPRLEQLSPQQLQELMAKIAPAGVSQSKAPVQPASWWATRWARVGYLSLLGVIVVGIGFLPSPWGLRAPGVIGFANPTAIRTSTDGFLTELSVVDGQEVKQGDLIARLENPELQNELELTRLKLETSKEQASGFRARGELALLQAEEAKIESLADHLQQLETRFATLQLIAPHDGRVILATADKILGRFIQPGQPLCMVVNPNSLEIRALASQRDAASFVQNSNQTLWVCGASGESEAARLVSIDRRGSDICPEPSLAANYGGPLTVEVGVDKQGAPELKFAESRFEVIAELDASASVRWVPGQLVSVTLSGKPQRLWQALWEAAIQTIEQRAGAS